MWGGCFAVQTAGCTAMSIETNAHSLTRGQRIELALSTLNVLTLSLLLLIGISFVAYMGWIGEPTSPTFGVEELNRLLWLPYLAFGVSFVGLPIFVEYRRGQNLRTMGLFPGQGWLTSLGVGLLIGLLWFLGVAALSAPLNRLLDVRDASGVAPILLLGNYFAVAVGEEVLMRVFVQRRLSEVIGAGWAIIATGFVFGLVLHLSNPLVSNLLYRVPAGIALGYLFHRRRTVWAPISAHWLFNSMPVLIAMLT